MQEKSPPHSSSIEVTVTTLETWQKVVDAILKSEAKTILLTGNLGAGKTTLTQFLVKTLGSPSTVTSPTFSLVNVYERSLGPIYHMDLYRLESYDELFNAGIEEYFFENNAICIVEWPELISDTDLVEGAISIKIETNEKNRKVLISQI